MKVNISLKSNVMRTFIFLDKEKQYGVRFGNYGLYVLGTNKFITYDKTK